MWNFGGRSPRELVDEAVLRELLHVIETALGKGGSDLPESLRGARPFMVSRDFGKLSWSRDLLEFYRFQFGPRIWSNPVYLNDRAWPNDSRPQYEKDAEQVAKALKQAEWEKLAQRLVRPESKLPPDKAETCTNLIALSFQGDGWNCAVIDRPLRRAFHFRWAEDRLILLGEEAHPARLNGVNEQSYERPIVSQAEGEHKLQNAEKAGQIEEFKAAVRWRYANRLDGALDDLLIEACELLAGIEGDIGMAFARHRFNDAIGDDAWLAVRLGDFAWENGAYFRNNAASLRGAPPQVHELVGMLVHLQACGISTAFERCYGYRVESLDVVGLFREKGHHYFACCNSQGSCGPVYEIDRERRSMTLCGFTDRYDWNFNNGAREGGVTPKESILELVPLEEIVRRVETGEISGYGPPYDMDVPWMAYLPRDPHA